MVPPEEETATHTCVLAWRISWTGAPLLSARLWKNIFAKCCESKVASWKMDGRESMRMEKEGIIYRIYRRFGKRVFIADLWMVK